MKLHISPAHYATVTAFCLSLVNAIILPDPPGPYHVGLSTTKLVDHKRLDAFDPKHGQRAIMISIFYPVPRSPWSAPSITPYLPPATAAFENQAYTAYGIPNGSLPSIEHRFYTPHPESNHGNRLDRYPLILFSPAADTSRLFYNALAASLASTGYVVTTIDHPYDADIVEFPDGTTIFSNFDQDNLTQIELAITARVQDASFVLDSLSKPSTLKSLFPGCTAISGLDVNRVGIFGHSVGGVAAAQSVLKDTRFVGGANLDGSFFGPVIKTGLKKPFLLFEQEAKIQTPDETWEAIWPRLKGWKLLLALKNSKHYTFSDLPFLVKELGLGGSLPQAVFDTYLGTLDGARALEAVGTYVQAFFDMLLKGNGTLLRGESKEFPEVVFVKRG